MRVVVRCSRPHSDDRRFASAAAYADRVLRRPDLPLSADRMTTFNAPLRTAPDHPRLQRGPAPARPADASTATTRVQARRPRRARVALSSFGMRAMINITARRSGRTATEAERHATGPDSRRLPGCSRRYDGLRNKGYVGLWSVWNEPICSSPSPAYAGKKIVSAANYAKLARSHTAAS